MAVFRNICVHKIQILKTCHMFAITNLSRINILIHQNYVRILVEYCHTLWKESHLWEKWAFLNQCTNVTLYVSIHKIRNMPWDFNIQVSATIKQPWKTGCSPLKQSILKVLGNFVFMAILKMNKNSISQTLWKAPCLHEIFGRKANSCHMQSTCKTHANRLCWFSWCVILFSQQL